MKFLCEELSLDKTGQGAERFNDTCQRRHCILVLKDLEPEIKRNSSLENELDSDWFESWPDQDMSLKRIRNAVLSDLRSGSYWIKGLEEVEWDQLDFNEIIPLCYCCGFSERPQSFGLHSPDQLPASESDFEAIASSFGLRSPDTAVPQEHLHPSYNPRLFCDGGLYLDPDIIGKSQIIFLFAAN